MSDHKKMELMNVEGVGLTGVVFNGPVFHISLMDHRVRWVFTVEYLELMPFLGDVKASRARWVGWVYKLFGKYNLRVWTGRMLAREAAGEVSSSFGDVGNTETGPAALPETRTIAMGRSRSSQSSS